MHPIFGNRRRLALYLALWLPVGGLLALTLGGGEIGWIQSLLIGLPLALFYGNICLAAWYLCRAFPPAASRASQLAATHLSAAVLSSTLWLLAGRGWLKLLAAARPAYDAAIERFTAEAPLLLLAGVLLFLLAVALSYAFIGFEMSREAERRALELKVLAREAELKALRAQIDPHFLFNCLHSLAALATSDPAAARRMAILLGDFLRESLRLGARDAIPLGDELSLVERYFAIEQVRFGARLALERDTATGAERALVPPLLLQPLAENAITHGIANLLEGGVVRISAIARDGRVEIAVENPYDPDNARHGGAGVGLNNVRQRIERFFGSDGRVDVSREPDRFRVVLQIPQREAVEAA